MINPDPKLKKALSEKIRRRLSKQLEGLGFKRTTARDWTRPSEYAVEFIHLHLFSFAAHFRVHLGIRVLNDEFGAIALNGPHSRPGPYENGLRYNFRFTTKPETVDRCSSELHRFIVERGEPWFKKLARVEELLERSTSPLNEKEKDWLRLAVRGGSDQSRINKSRALLGLDK